MKKYFLIIYLSTLSIALCAQTWQDTIVKIEKIFSRYKTDTPGCQLSISRNGKVIFSQTWGKADLERNVPLTINSILEAASVSKQFTAAAILLLEQQGKLSLNDDVRKYIPELPYYGTVIRIKHLIHHTSGLRDWSDIVEMTGWPRTTKAYSNADALYIICQQNKLNNLPGDEVIYSNSNYNLLAIIIERVSGMSLEDYTAKYIFNPAEMKNTQWRDNYKKIVANRALAYIKTEKGYETEMPNENIYGNTGLLTTSEDLIKWNEFYLNGRFGTPSLLPNQLAPDILNNGEINHYAAGLYVQEKNGLQCIYHNGSTAGYRCYLENYPQLKLSIAFLSNTSQFGSSAAVKEIENYLINYKENPILKNESKQKTTGEYNNFTGWYKNEKTGHGICILIKNEELALFDNTPLTQTKINEFISGNIIFSFKDNDLLKIIKPNSFGAGTIDTFKYDKIIVKQIVQNIGEYVGEYYSKEAQASCSIILNDNNKLGLVQRPGQLLELMPTYTDGYYIDSLEDNLYFKRDLNNKIIKMYISDDGARNVEFLRIK
jgi:CubicO group peptidase (beta-lactamase class C family)